ncbi:MAG: Hsp20/alpha crystallin family protein [Chitinophagaceae bacterium]
MTLVKFNQKPIEKRVNSLFDDFFNGIPSRFFQDEPMPQNGLAPVNIIEKENQFLIELQVPGYDKSEFKIHMDQSTLTISAEKKHEQTTETDRIVKKEFSTKSFSRSFTLDESVLSEDIVAKYENGVLNVTLPKKEKNKIQPKAISIQ